MAGHMLATFSSAFAEDSMDDDTRAEKLAAGGVEQSDDVEWHGTNLATASNAERQGVLENTVIAEFKTRLARIGLEYQAPTTR